MRTLALLSVEITFWPREIFLDLVKQSGLAHPFSHQVFLSVFM